MPDGRAAPRAGSRPGRCRRRAPHPLWGATRPEIDVERRRLPRPVGPDEPDDGPGLRHEADPVERVHAAELHGQALDLEAGRMRRWSARRSRSPTQLPSAASDDVGRRRRAGAPARPGAPAPPRIASATRSPARWSNSARPPGRYKMNTMSPRPLVMNWIVWLEPKRAGQALEVDGAEDGAGDRTQPPDDHHGDDHERGRGVEGDVGVVELLRWRRRSRRRHSRP